MAPFPGTHEEAQPFPGQRCRTSGAESLLSPCQTLLKFLLLSSRLGLSLSGLGLSEIISEDLHCHQSRYTENQSRVSSLQFCMGFMDFSPHSQYYLTVKGFLLNPRISCNGGCERQKSFPCKCGF